MQNRYMLIMGIDCGYFGPGGAAAKGKADDPNDDGYECPMPETQTPTPTTTSTTTTSSTSTETTQSSWPTEYYDAPTAAGCEDSGCTECSDGFGMVCVTDVRAKETRCHCEYKSGCSRDAPDLGTYSPTHMAIERDAEKKRRRRNKNHGVANTIF